MNVFGSENSSGNVLNRFSIAPGTVGEVSLERIEKRVKEIIDHKPDGGNGIVGRKYTGDRRRHLLSRERDRECRVATAADRHARVT